MSNAVETSVREGVLVVRFTRPEIRNPLSVAVLEELGEIVDRAGENAVIFTGTHNVFASGADIREISNVSPEKSREFALRGQNLFKKIAKLRESFAAVNGFCFGGALDLSLSCKRRVASPNAIFAHPGANLGIITGWGGTQRLPRLVGESFALEMFLLAKRVSAEEALSRGLIDAIDDDPLEYAMKMAAGR